MKNVKKLFHKKPKANGSEFMPVHRVNVAPMFFISNQIIDEFVAVLKDWKIIFDSNPLAQNYIRS